LSGIPLHQKGSYTRSLGLDIGDKRIGVALSDRGGVIAGPLTIIERTGEQEDIDTILDIVRRNEVDIIIAGLPVSMDGGIGHQAGKVQSFIENLKRSTDIIVEYRDESLTTLEARDLMKVTRKKKKREKEKDDAIAAAFILQHYLDEER
jgi:putative Holliday junction resolvase